MSRLWTRLVVAGTCVAVVGAGPIAPAAGDGTRAAARTPVIKPWGFDLAGMDPSVRPGDDFAHYGGGAWQKKTRIPDDRTRWGAFAVLGEQADLDVKALVEEIAAKRRKPGTDEQRIADYYASFLDTAAIEAKGLSPIRPLLDEIEVAPDATTLAVIAARPGSRVIAPLGWSVAPDQKNPDVYSLSVGQSGLGLPDRTYYSGPSAKPATLAAYRAHIGRMLSLAGVTDPARKADDILAFEQKVASHHWLPEALRERDQTYNPRTVAELQALAPNFPWSAAFEASLVGSARNVIVRQLDAVGPLADTWAGASLPTLKAYFTYHALRNSAGVLPRAFDDERFAFFGTTLNGQPKQLPRDRRAVAALNSAMGEAVGRHYVARHFPPQAKARMQALVETMRAAYADRIAKLTWMSADTRKRAAEKLAQFTPKIGYPDTWRDYSALTITRGDAFGNAVAVAEFEQRRRFTRLGKKTDRGEWNLLPQAVNATYSPAFNEITFPAAILQAPFFDPHADPAVNYGGIGAVIGHEMGHGFDDQGAKSDGHGVLRDWWGPDDVARFTALTDKLVEQYSAFEVRPGLFVNGRLTLGENIGDNGGLQVAHAAYRRSLQGRTAPVLDGFTGDQRFFLGYSQVWRELVRDEALRNQIASGPHSPAHVRTVGPVRNMDAWYRAFDVRPGQKNYLPPEQRVLIW